MAEGDLDKVGQHHLKNMHIMGVKTERADAPWSCQQTPSKKVKSKRKGIFFWSLLLPNLFREGAHMGKIRLEKR